MHKYLIKVKTEYYGPRKAFSLQIGETNMPEVFGSHKEAKERVNELNEGIMYLPHNAYSVSY